MIYTVKGELTARGENFFVAEVHGVGFKIFTNHQTVLKLVPGQEIKVFCFLHVREELMELYGFLEEGTLKLFEMLNKVSGIGPKTALNVLDLDSTPNIMAAIIEKRVDLLTRSSGIGKKTAERIVLELQSKIKLPESRALTEKMKIDIEVEEALVSLGYLRGEVKRALSGLGEESQTLEDRLRSALKTLSRNK